MERTIQEAKTLIDKAVEVIRAHSDARALSINERIDFQRGRSNRTDYLDWAVWFLKWGDNLPTWLLVPWYAHIGRAEWEERHRHKAEIAVERFMVLVPGELWEQGGKIDV